MLLPTGLLCHRRRLGSFWPERTLSSVLWAVGDGKQLEAAFRSWRGVTTGTSAEQGVFRAVSLPNLR